MFAKMRTFRSDAKIRPNRPGRASNSILRRRFDQGHGQGHRQREMPLGGSFCNLRQQKCAQHTTLPRYYSTFQIIIRYYFVIIINIEENSILHINRYLHTLCVNCH